MFTTFRSGDVFKKIAGEMLNIETGKTIFDANGDLINSDTYKDHVTFIHGDVKAICRPFGGTIFISDIDNEEFSEILKIVLGEMEYQYEKILEKYNHCNGWFPTLQRGGNGLTRVGIFIDAKKNLTTEIRSFRDPTHVLYYWLINHISGLFRGQKSRERYAMIILDKRGALIYEEGKKYKETPKIEDICLTKYINKNLLPKGKLLFSEVFWHMNLKFSTVVREALSVSIRFACPCVRNILPDTNVLKQSKMIDINNININNNVKNNGTIIFSDTQASNTNCRNCNVPLYGEIYVILIDKEKKEYVAFCKYCIRCSCCKKVGSSNNLAYNYSDTVCRTIFPRTLQQLFSETGKSGIIFDIICAMSDPKKFIPLSLYCANKGHTSEPKAADFYVAITDECTYLMNYKFISPFNIYKSEIEFIAEQKMPMAFFEFIG